MLIMKRMIHPYEVRKCKISEEFIVYGDYYYQDDEDPKILVKASVYNSIKKAEREANFDYSLLNAAQSTAEYDRMVKQAERDYLTANILKMPIYDQGHPKSHNESNNY